MSAVATAAPEPSSRSFISASAAARRAGISTIRLQRLALLGRIRVDIREGETPKYNREDADRLRHDACV